LLGVATKPEMADGVFFRAGFYDEQVAVLAHAKVVETVPFEGLLEGEEDKGVFAELRHGSGGKVEGWANELA
jgi:hypothetical protein